MNFGFSYTTVYTPKKPVDPDFSKNLPIEIRQHASCEYTCMETPEGLVLNPTFRYGRNSYMPCIRIARSGEGDNHTLTITGELAPFVRVFMCFWFLGIVMIAAFAALIFWINKEFHAVPFLVMACMGILGYLLIKFFTKMYYDDIVAIIIHTAP